MSSCDFREQIGFVSQQLGLGLGWTESFKTGITQRAQRPGVQHTLGTQRQQEDPETFCSQAQVPEVPL